MLSRIHNFCNHLIAYSFGMSKWIFVKEAVRENYTENADKAFLVYD